MPIAVCDYCGGEIKNAGSASVEHHSDVSDIAICHKTQRCNDRYRQSRHTLSRDGWHWQELRRYIADLRWNVGA